MSEQRGTLRPNRKGEPRRGGRARGTPNKTTADVRRAILLCADRLGGLAALVKWARKNPDLFWSRLYLKCLPETFNAQVAVDIGLGRYDAREKLRRQIEGAVLAEEREQTTLPAPPLN